MLAPAVRRLLDAGTPVLSLSRNPERLGPHPLLTGVVADWADPAGLRQAARGAYDGPLGVALLWVHTAYRGGVYPVVDELLTDDAVVVEVNGSAAGPSDRKQSEQLLAKPGRTLRRVRLGSVVEGGTRSWLTHDEISAGALRALAGGPDDQAVGEAT